MVHQRIFNTIFFRNDGSLGSSCKSQFRQETGPITQYKKNFRQILPIAMTVQLFYKPFLNEFDTVGIIARIRVDETSQDLWLTDFVGR